MLTNNAWFFLKKHYNLCYIKYLKEIIMNSIHADLSASISELKKSPTGLLNQAGGRPIAILNHNKPTAYLIPADLYASMVAVFEDVELLNPNIS